MDDCSEGALVAGIAAAVSMTFVHAAEIPPTVGPPVVVTATRIDESASHYLIGARVITAQDIARSGASTLWELLRGSPDIRTRDLPPLNPVHRSRCHPYRESRLPPPGTSYADGMDEDDPGA